MVCLQNGVSCYQVRNAGGQIAAVIWVGGWTVKDAVCKVMCGLKYRLHNYDEYDKITNAY